LGAKTGQEQTTEWNKRPDNAWPYFVRMDDVVMYCLSNTPNVPVKKLEDLSGQTLRAMYHSFVDS